MKKNTVNYSDYLYLDQLLASQNCLSTQLGQSAHDEMLFIIIHQAFELWFKQILHELDAVIAIFEKNEVNDNDIFCAVNYLHRITEIQRLMVAQFAILKTMTPMDFLEFRNLLVPASGFQSVQFRILEGKLGLYLDSPPESLHFLRFFDDERQARIIEKLQGKSLFKLIEHWLERTPFVQSEMFSFLQTYQVAAMKMLDQDEQAIFNDHYLSDEEREIKLQQIQNNRSYFISLFDKEKHESYRRDGHKKLGFEATMAALFIYIYRDEPALHSPYRLLASLVDMDELLTQWRYAHALMAHRMIGGKIGTGGTSGHDYLKRTAEQNKIFGDLANLATYLIPRSSVPDLPQECRRWLGLSYSQ